MPNILSVYPQFPDSFWSFKYALPFIHKKAVMPPLGLLTIPNVLPTSFYKHKVVDLNVEPLKDNDLRNADIVFTSAMLVQKDSMYEVVDRAHNKKIPIVAGGPFPSLYTEDIKRDIPGKVTHFFHGQVLDGRLLEFFDDLKKGGAREVYAQGETPETNQQTLLNAPPPLYSLVDLNNYASVGIQFSAGCPFKCKFCEIPELFGDRTVTKTDEQMLAECEILFLRGWRGSVFFVDDNFIGNKIRVLQFLPKLAQWQQERGYPFSFYTQASVNLVEIEGLPEMMVRAGFGMVFLGIETVNPNTLRATGKNQNTKKKEGGYDNNYLIESIRSLQKIGLQVTCGLITGLDGDDENVFDQHIDFVQTSGIGMVMDGILAIIKGAPWYNQYKSEGRLVEESVGNNTSLHVNFIPKNMTKEKLVEGYKRVLATIYDPRLKNYFERCFIAFEHSTYTGHNGRSIGLTELRAFWLSICKQLFSRQGPAYAKFLWKVFRKDYRMIPEAVEQAIKGYSLQKVTKRMVTSL